jgi:hypothetical protein
MTYFKLVSGFDCGVDKSVCQLGYPENCLNCLSKKFSDVNILMDIVEAIEQHSEEKRREMLYKHIWRKYQDILTIRHVIILSKGGLPGFNMPVGDMPIDASLISGFIQANVAFSSEDLTLMDKIKPEKDFYEFEYKNFLILLRNGQLCRICLILDKKPSSNLKELLSNFTNIFEEMFKDELNDFENTGDLSLLEPVKNLVETSFEVTMKYPLKISSQIPPSKVETLPLIQKAIYECGKELLKEESYFFIPILIEETIKLIGDLSREEILWNIYQLMRENLIFWEESDVISTDFESENEEIQKREHVIKTFMDKKELDEIFFEAGEMSEEEAQKKIRSLVKKGEIAEKAAAYQEALNEYQKALIYAREFNLDIDIGKISFKILETEKLNKKVEIEFAMEQASKSEKKKNYAITLKYLFQTKEILIEENDDGKHDKQLQKIDQRIKKIQSYFQL